jgi:aspartate carbamoyltransferase catalytic subunit
MKHLLSIEKLTRQEMERILRTVDDFKRPRPNHARPLEG